MAFFKFFKKESQNEVEQEISENNEIDLMDELDESSRKEFKEEDISNLEQEELPIEEITLEESNSEEISLDEEVTDKKTGFFGKLVKGLSKTRGNIVNSVTSVISNFKKIDEELYEELEEALIMADMGVETSLYIIEQLREKVKEKRLTESESVKNEIMSIIEEILLSGEQAKELKTPTVILIIGVNGAGKTTTIGKLSNMYKQQGKKVLIAAADTFRAAAIDQLEVWAKRSDCPIIRQQEGSDPGAVVYDACNAAKARAVDVLICDTAGRLHNKKNLMDELSKINKIISGQFPEAEREIFIVIDSTAGQNSLQQVKIFKEVCDITGIVLTKLDGTAKGGIVVAIQNELKIPVRYVGIGEKIEDLQPFEPSFFAKALFTE